MKSISTPIFVPVAAEATLINISIVVEYSQ
jgi:hypothetical protein